MFLCDLLYTAGSQNFSVDENQRIVQNFVRASGATLVKTLKTPIQASGTQLVLVDYGHFTTFNEFEFLGTVDSLRNITADILLKVVASEDYRRAMFRELGGHSPVLSNMSLDSRYEVEYVGVSPDTQPYEAILAKIEIPPYAADSNRMGTPFKIIQYYLNGSGVSVELGGIYARVRYLNGIDGEIYTDPNNNSEW